ncbi:hypothetical protein [Myxacorys almedinensis]|nr:hypothetical protein [Myxacorys almedinensis]
MTFSVEMGKDLVGASTLKLRSKDTIWRASTQPCANPLIYSH